MQMEKISISLPAPLVEFFKNYKIIRVRKSSSQVIKLALDL
jgi:metal-responsive CopG/Arc/MetJ family transcriptional regulator